MRRMRTATEALPTEIAERDGLAYSLWLPERRPARGGVVILHGAGSCKESHHDYARVVLGAGFGAVAFDQRGHGGSSGPMDARVLDDVAAMAALLRERAGGDPELPIALRGSSMGGYFAIAAAPVARAAAVVAICPASAEGMRRGLSAERFNFEADAPALDALFAEHDEMEIADALEVPVLLLHADGDEVVPVQLSRELAAHLQHPRSRLITLPGGHHRSIQHDHELQAVSLRFIEQALSA